MSKVKESRGDLKRKVGKGNSEIEFMGSDQIILNDFKHLPGDHCVTCSLRKVFLYYGFNVSEDMLLGLGSGLGLIYWAMKNMVPFIGGRGNGKFYEFEKAVCDRLGVGVKLYKTSSAKRAYADLKEVLGSRQPGYVSVDMPYLKYLCLPEEAHFGGHVVDVYGIDEVNNTVYVSDRLKNPSHAAVNELVEARGSNHPPFAANNKMLRFEFPKELRDLREVLPEAIRQNMSEILNPPIKNLGIKAYELIPQKLKEWPKLYGDSDLLMTMFNSYIYIEKGGTGGGLFRRMYSRFLMEASEILNLSDLASISSQIAEAAEKWTLVAKMFLPDELPNARKIRETIDKKDEILMESREGYVEKAKLLDSEVNRAVKEAIPETRDFARFIPEISNTITECGEIEKKAFQELQKIVENL
nr:BtrH N-terminal domain-containing protein [Candidatus Freyarchaeota archaeon]